jgi:uncharacterized membrane protein YdjX (TVP38/TMEM64 family)
MQRKKLSLLFTLIAALCAFFWFDLGHYFSIGFLKSSQHLFDSYYQAHPLFTIAIYFTLYVAVTALSFPGAVIVTLTGGALFGFTMGVLLVSFASAIGSTLAFLSARHLLRDWVQQAFSRQLASIDAKLQDDSASYLFMLRLVPVFPFFAVNLLMGLTTIRTWTFYWVSQIGMLAGTLVFVNAGTQLAHINSLRDILSPQMIGSFVILGIFPLVTRHVCQLVKAHLGDNKAA